MFLKKKTAKIKFLNVFIFFTCVGNFLDVGFLSFFKIPDL